MNAFDVVHVIKEAVDLATGIGEVVILGQIDLLFFVGAHELFRIPILPRLTDGGHAERHAEATQSFDVGRRRVWYALIGVMT